MLADLRKKSTYVSLDGEEIVNVVEIETWHSVRENKIYHNSNKA